MMTKSPSEHLTPTPASDWRRTRIEGVALELPSGKVALLRNVPVARLLMKGLIADPLMPIVLEILNGKQQKLDKLSAEKVAEAHIALQSELCKLAFVSPQVVDENPNDDQITLDDISDEDQKFVTNLLYASVERLAQELFREKSQSNVSPVAKEQALPTTSQ